MHRGFTKLFNTIVTSTIWREDDKTRIVWITMLAIADRNGVVSAALPGLAAVANVSIEAAEKAIDNLSDVDPYSRTRDFNGRRIKEIEGGWLILNYAKYRSMLTTEERLEYKAKWEREKRAKKKHGQRGQNMDSVDSQGQTRTTASASASASASSSEEYIEELSKDSTYSGINVKIEFGKMMRWCEANRQKPSKRRFINWLNRIDKPLELPKPEKRKPSNGEAKWI